MTTTSPCLLRCNQGTRLRLMRSYGCSFGGGGYFVSSIIAHMFAWLLKHIFTGVTLLTSMGTVSYSITPPPVFKENLVKHNLFRYKHHSPPLVWNASLQAAASHWLQRCKFEHDPDRRWGENLYMIQFTPYTSIPKCATSAVVLWYNEVKTYNYSAPTYNHFTQVVWKATRHLGCASKVCPMYDSRYLVISCKYWPHGNVWGQFKRNVLPP